MLRFKPNRASKSFDHLLAEGEAEAGTSRLSLQIRAEVLVKLVRSPRDIAEHREDRLLDLVGHPNAIVGNAQSHLFSFGASKLGLNLDFAALSRKLDCIHY